MYCILKLTYLTLLQTNLDLGKRSISIIGLSELHIPIFTTPLAQTNDL